MRSFFIQTLTMFLGSLLPVWLRAVAQCGENFNLQNFLTFNRFRFFLCASGVLIISGLLALDPGGIQTLITNIGVTAEIVSSSVLGFAVSSFVMAKQSSAPLENPQEKKL